MFGVRTCVMFGVRTCVVFGVPHLACARERLCHENVFDVRLEFGRGWPFTWCDVRVTVVWGDKISAIGVP